ncbi:MAG: thiamine phosphate synthase [Desulfobulbaceae bacterium]|jgi:thiamine-phosphate pyrophosphorylase|nr:thiamine phosphate synthase [Desulfobulbaceae bacterium]
MKAKLPQGIYGITAEKFSRGRSNVEVAQQMIAGGCCGIIQYREKRPDKTFADMLAECRHIRALTREAGVIFIVNDYPALALMADADGVHVGQDDFPPAEVRKLIGPDKLIGLSTHSPAQEVAARSSGADYIGVGPIFATKTKSDICKPVGFSYLDYVVKNSPMPFVAIGGIKETNIGEVLAHGAKTVCLVTEIVGSADIVATVGRLRRMWKK